MSTWLSYCGTFQSSCTTAVNAFFGGFLLQKNLLYYFHMLSRFKRMLGFGSGDVKPVPQPEKRSVLEEQEKRWMEERVFQRETSVNDGEPPTAQLKVVKNEKKEKVIIVENDREIRGKVSEDSKINDRENGLMLVADGVSGESIKKPDGTLEKPYTGVIASTIMAEVAQAYLGKSLSEQISLLKKEQSPQTDEQIDTLVVRELARTIFRANKAILDQVAENKADHFKQDISGAATTATLSRRVTMSDGKERLYFTNVGDSRGYLLRKGEIIRLTDDDSYASLLLAKKLGLHDSSKQPEELAKLTQKYKELLTQIEQAEGEQSLPKELRDYYNARNIIVRAVGMLNQGERQVSNEELLKDLEGRVRYMDLEEDDEIVHVSDGVSDNLTEAQIKAILTDTSKEAQKKSAEQRLQEASEAVIRDVKNPRSKADDVAATHYKVGSSQKEVRQSDDEGELLDPMEVMEIEEEELVEVKGPSAEDLTQWNQINDACLAEIRSIDRKLKKIHEVRAKYERKSFEALRDRKEETEKMKEEYRAVKNEEQELIDQRMEVEHRQVPYKYQLAETRIMELLPTLPKPIESKTQVVLPESFRSEALDDSVGSDGGSVDILAGWRNGGFDTEMNSYLVSRGKANIWVGRYELDLAQEYAKNPLLALKPGDIVKSGKQRGWKVVEVESSMIHLTNPKAEDEYRMVPLDRTPVLLLEELVYLEKEKKDAEQAKKQYLELQKQRKATEEAAQLLGARQRAQRSAR